MSTALTTHTSAAPAAITSNWVKAISKGGHITDAIQGGPLTGYSRAMVDTIKATVAKGAPDEQLVVFMMQAVTYGLDPFKKQIWCVNMAGANAAPQWMVAPSRDGYLIAAQRHPLFASIKSDVIRHGDSFTYDPVAGMVDHRPDFFGSGAIVGAWAMVTLKDGTRTVKVVKSIDVKRDTPIWRQHEAKMTVKCAETLALKYSVNIDGLTVTDDQLARIEEMAEQNDAILITPDNVVWEDGFPTGQQEPRRIAASTGEVLNPPPEAVAAVTVEPKPGPKQIAFKAYADRCAELAGEVEGSTDADQLAARAAFLNGANTKGMTAADLRDWLDTLNGDQEGFKAMVRKAMAERLAADDDIPAPDFGGEPANA